MGGLFSYEEGESAKKNAAKFLDLCDGGHGWEGKCDALCVADATFRGQCGAFHPPSAPAANLGGRLEEYVGWMAMMANSVMPGSKNTDVSIAWDGTNSIVTIFATFHGTHTQTPGGAPLPPPTNQSTVSDFVYKLHFDEQGKIDSLVKVWNSDWAMAELGWQDKA
eukprot:g3800.t1